MKVEETIMKNEHQCLAFAEDLTILAKTEKKLRRIVKKIIKEAQKFELELKEDKTKYMIMGEAEGKKEDFSVRYVSGKSYSFKRVDKFEYLGVVFDENGKEKWELEARIAKGNKKLASLRALLNSKYVSRQGKLRIYKTVIRPTVKYAGETWTLNETLNKKEEDTLERWEREILRRIFGGRKTEDGWERRTINELMALYKEPTITKFVKSQRIRWLGHVERMAANRMPKLVITRKLIGPKRRGRPRKR
ncbi:uncharacterized protein [Diabrotica undecimpunctata]|uniref:uncharacterized protein n=1 Tax=Diabrotica undecimpunctata TaxID=50387 RepID=UPI003B632751